jgi:hypothetical protein
LSLLLRCFRQYREEFALLRKAVSVRPLDRLCENAYIDRILPSYPQIVNHRHIAN